MPKSGLPTCRYCPTCGDCLTCEPACWCEASAGGVVDDTLDDLDLTQLDVEAGDPPDDGDLDLDRWDRDDS
ncbi:MAG TPA: hypothetical protein VFP27_06185 [Mycobacterium sp.]|nr:hypothetical protein [Mycobacterium sp.]